MRLIEVNKKKGYLTLIPENLTDLYYLSLYFEEGDIIKSWTSRKVKPPRERKRSDEGKRIPVTLTINVRSTEFKEFSNALRVKGVIVEDVGEIGIKGAFHTINMKPGAKVTIKKKKWSEQLLNYIKSAEEEAIKPRILAITLDYEEATVALITYKRIKLVSRVNSRIPGKQVEESEREKALLLYFKKLAEEIEKNLSRIKIDKVIIAGPGFAKEKFYSFLKNKDYTEKIKIVSTSSATVSGIEELVKRGVLQEIVNESSITEDSKLLSKMMELLLRKSRKVAIGLEEVKNAAQYGAIDLLLVSEKMLWKKESREQVKEIISTIKTTKGKARFISTTHEAGKYLESFGGIAAFLRFPV